MTTAEVDEARLIEKILENGHWISVAALKEFASEQQGAKAGWPAINRISSLLKNSLSERRRMVEGVEVVDPPRLQVLEYRTDRRSAAKKQGRKVQFYAPSPLPDDWPAGDKDDDFIEEKLNN